MKEDTRPITQAEIAILSEAYYQDLAAEEAFERWQAVEAMEHGDSPTDGPCLVDENTGHTTAF